MRIIVITCIEDFDTLHEAMELGVTGYLLKATMTREDLLGVLRRALEELGEASYSRPVSAAAEPDATGAVLLVSFPPSASAAQIRSASAAVLEKISSLGFWSASSHGQQTEFLLPLPASVPDFDRLCAALSETREYLPRVLGFTPSFLYYIHDGSARRLQRLHERAPGLLNDPYFSGGIAFLDSDFVISTAHSRRLFAMLRENPAYTGYRDGARREQALELLDRAVLAFGVSRSAFDTSILAFAERVFGADGFLPAPKALASLRAGVASASTAEQTLTLLVKTYPELSLHPVYGDALLGTIHYIHENLASPLQLPTLARQISISANYYALLFKAAVGLSVTEFIARLRLEHACDLLMEGQLSTQEIARACSFADVPYFSRFFKQYTGLPPRRWKNRHE